MEQEANGTRRWLGAVALCIAITMLVAGETVLKGRLHDVAFLFYWLACFALTALAILMAFLDVRALQRRIRAEQKDLMQSTLDKIQSEARKGRED